MFKLKNRQKSFFYSMLLLITLGIVFKSDALTTIPYTKSWVANKGVEAIAQGPDGFTYLGGTFTRIGPYTGGGVPLNISDGKMLANFPKVNGPVNSIIPDGNGGWYLGGSFDRVGEFERKGIAHLLADFSVDPSLNFPLNGSVYSLYLRGSALYVGGDFKFTAGGKDFINLVRFQNHLLDQSWAPAGNAKVYVLARKDEFIYAGGYGYLFNKNPKGDVIDIANHLGRYSIGGTGVFDGSWKPEPDHLVSAIAFHDRFLYVGGHFFKTGGKEFGRLVRFDFNNSLKLDETWKPNLQTSGNQVADLLIHDRFLYVAGDFGSVGGKEFPALVRFDLNNNATLDETWKPNPTSKRSVSQWVGTLAIDRNFLYAGGWFGSLGEKEIPYLARFDLSKNGALDESFTPNPSERVDTLAIDGNFIYTGGQFGSMNSEQSLYLARLNPDGTFDAGWKPNLNNHVYSLVRHDRFLYVGGIFTKVKNNPAPLLVRFDLSKNGELDASWLPSPTGTGFDGVNSLVLQNNFLYAGGRFKQVFNESFSALARFNLEKNGELDLTWKPIVDLTRLGSGVLSLATRENNLYVAGFFEKLDGRDIPNLARFDLSRSDGQPDFTWIPAPNHSVEKIALNERFLYAGGYFTRVGGRPEIQHLARFDFSKNGELDTGWIQKLKPVDKPETTWISTLAMSGNTLYAAGRFSAVNDQNIPYLVRFNPDGNLDTQWNTAIREPFAGIYSLAIGNGSLYLWSTHTFVGGVYSPQFAEIRAPVQFAKPQAEGNRKAKKVDIEVVLNEPNLADQVTVDYKVSGNAKKGEDYRLENGTLTIPAGQNHGFIPLEIFETNKPETSVIEVSLLNPTEAFLGKNDKFTYTLLAADRGDVPPPKGDTTPPGEIPTEARGGGGCGCALHPVPLNQFSVILWIGYFMLLGIRRMRKRKTV